MQAVPVRQLEQGNVDRNSNRSDNSQSFVQVQDLRQRRYGRRLWWVHLRKFFYAVRNILINTWMIGVYFVVKDVEVTRQADINRKELTLDLALFCFQWVATFWFFAFGIATMVLLVRRNTRSANIGFSLIMIIILPIIGFAYYRNLVLLKAAQELNQDLTNEEHMEKTQSPFILVCYFILVFAAHFTWFIMNFALGFFTAAFCQIYFEQRRNRQLNEME